ncbi:flavin reductase [Oceanobacter sp. 5_MG-2023]|jgi:flavin reductase|uniref:flavin reductase n=1 Tax=Oceanobacter sp. 5_MG-2023 TaxID=3062645 RepID=UPI0026E1C375|nr:flavin reductase [Oceanobacter sp. 5_MG-2023]MDO6683261.1 flavin reductase [Oceanobacter sp. 5_MG-2023]
MVDIQLFRNGMSLLGGAVTVITTDGDAGRFGFTATAVSSVTDEPPTLLVCMNRNSYAHEHFKTNKTLCVNVLTGEHQGVSWDFANRELTSEERFAKHHWSCLKTGAPALDEALVNFDCVIHESHEMGSHTVFYCRIADVRIGNADDGLVYFNRAYHCLNDKSVAS